MTDGIIEKIGWLEMGGWRIGVRAPGGAYLYYAHLYSYAGDFKEGDRIKAGELIGYMGDTGYGKTEGTRGNFDVHLHVGIYIKTDHNEGNERESLLDSQMAGKKSGWCLHIRAAGAVLVGGHSGYFF